MSSALEQAGLEQERGSLRLKVEALEAQMGSDLELTFRLGAGGLAAKSDRLLVDFELTGVTS